MSYLREFSTRTTPQSEPMPGQVPNSAGGHAWQVGDWQRLARFLVLGSEGGSHYATERALTRENAQAVMRCIAADGRRAVREIVAVSEAGRAPKNDPAIFALALACAADDAATRSAALDAIPDVCRIGTHLFHFAAYVEQFRGWGRGLRRGIAAWYEREDVNALAYQAIKYRQRDGWTHDDLLRLAHPSAPTPEHAAVYEWIARPEDGSRRPTGELPEIIDAYQQAQASESPEQTAALIHDHPDLPREALNPDHLTDPVVWEALLEKGMPMTALLRNLATMTRIGLLTNTSAATKTATDQLANTDAVRKSRIHPLNVLMALKTYASGRSIRGSAEWAPVARIVDALDALFYASFGNVEATGKRRLIALDVSGSMSGQRAGYGFADIAGFPGLSPREASSAMAMVSASTGDPYEVVAFTAAASAHYAQHGYKTLPQQHPGVSVLPLSARQRLDDICASTESIFPGRTDCALPMLYAAESGQDFDLFEIYTDNETYAGSIHPAQALVRYREKTGIPAKLAVIGMVSNDFSIADPSDPGMLDCVGFDSATPNVLAEFATA